MPHLIFHNHLKEIIQIDLSTDQSHDPRIPLRVQPWIDAAHTWIHTSSDFQMMTSGSTGVPKPITLLRHRMQASAELSAATFNLQSGSYLFCPLGIDYIAGLMMLIRALVSDGHLIISPPQGNPWQNWQHEFPIRLASLVPIQMQRILSDNTDIDDIDQILLGGSAISQSLIDALQGIAPLTFQSYSMTETYTHVALRKLNHGAQEAYQALGNYSFDTDEASRLIISHPEYMPLQTNDLVNLISPRAFLLLGRADLIINSGGIKIQLEQIEAVASAALNELYARPIRCMAYPIPDEKLGQALALSVEDMDIDLTKLMERLKELLPKYHLPKYMDRVGKLPETRTGKVQRPHQP